MCYKSQCGAEHGISGIQELVSTLVKMGWDRALLRGWEDIKCYQTQAAWRQSNLACLKEWGWKPKTVCGTNGSLALTSSVQCTHGEMSHEAKKNKWHFISHVKLVYQKCHAVAEWGLTIIKGLILVQKKIIDKPIYHSKPSFFKKKGILNNVLVTLSIH